MIIKCNSCEKKFVVPDNAITENGRLVQCSSCGNKWTQFPSKKNNQVVEKTEVKREVEIAVIPQKKKKASKKAKRNGPTIYSEEYLQKKHGIKIKDASDKKMKKISKKEVKIKFGFYRYLVTFLILLTFLLGVLNLTKDILILEYPYLKNFIVYLFETLNNINIIFVDFFSSY